MKRTTISVMAVLFTAVFNFSFAGESKDSLSSTNRESLYITTLVINADVTVILVNSDEAALEATGNTKFKKFVRLEKSGDTLVIDATRDKSLYEGTIYVPANHLRRIRVNSKAHVRSLFALQVANLDVIINGACDFSVANVGEVTLKGTDNFSFEEDRTVRQLPSSINHKINIAQFNQKH